MTPAQRTVKLSAEFTSVRVGHLSLSQPAPMSRSLNSAHPAILFASQDVNLRRANHSRCMATLDLLNANGPVEAAPAYRALPSQRYGFFRRHRYHEYPYRPRHRMDQHEKLR